ncbi:hypothetical protein D3C87_1993590 [compost metagenome]
MAASSILEKLVRNTLVATSVITLKGIIMIEKARVYRPTAAASIRFAIIALSMLDAIELAPRAAKVPLPIRQYSRSGDMVRGREF